MSTSPLRVLVLEDRPDDAELMIFRLEEAGFDVGWKRVDTEADFVEALSTDLDVILADYTLPSFDITHALKRLADSGLDVPLVVVSGTISEEVAVNCIKRGAADYLVKDRLARLPAAVTAALEARRLRVEQAVSAEALQRTAAELAAANEALRAADERKDQLLAVTAHELRTPLTSILGYAALLRQEWGTDARELGLEWVAVIEAQARRMSTFAEDLLTLAAVQSGVVDLQIEAISVADALSRAVAMAVPSQVAIACPPGLLVAADPARLEQIMTNLLNNAARHGGPVIRAEARPGPQPDCVEIRIRDDGSGVPAEFAPVMFDKYARASRRRPGSGFGLGLAIVASLTEAHGGEVWYEPELPTGACFAVRLPAPRRP